MAQVMVSMGVLEGSLQIISGSTRLTTSSRRRIGVARPRFTIRAQQVSSETETSRRAVLGRLVAAGLAAGSFTKEVLAGGLPVDGPKDTILGGYTPIKDPTDPAVQKIGKFAVTEHNKQANTNLTYEKVVKAEKQIVNGTNYRLTIEAKDGNDSKFYEAVVYEKLSGDLSLTSFYPLLK